eukprot:GDKI01029283.1.p1 GENE.GDKI01029283.1~~GDKI01029283.1.p1  ORF type:complete len:1276 (-),score=418.88 GDKI01029283.1:154-3570(-)
MWEGASIVRYYDSKFPSVVVTSDTLAGVKLAGRASLGIDEMFLATVTFSEVVKGFASADAPLLTVADQLALTNVTLLSVSKQSDLVWELKLKAAVNQGDIAVGVKSGVATDVAGNPNLEASRVLAFTYDGVAPVCRFSQSIPVTKHTKEEFTVSVDCGENIVDWSPLASCLQLVNAQVKSAPAKTNNQTYEFVLVGTEEATVLVGLRDDCLSDRAGNKNAPTPTTANQVKVLWDPTWPTVELTSMDGLVNGAYTNKQIVWFQAKFSEYIQTNTTLSFVAPEIVRTLTDRISSSNTQCFTPGPVCADCVDMNDPNNTYTFQCNNTVSGKEVSLLLPQSAAYDDAGNPSKASDKITFMFDRLVPEVDTISAYYTVSGQKIGVTTDRPINVPPTFVVKLNKKLNPNALTLDQKDALKKSVSVLWNGVAADETRYSLQFDVDSPSVTTLIISTSNLGATEGLVELKIDPAANSVFDVAGNQMVSAKSMTVSYDAKQPYVLSTSSLGRSSGFYFNVTNPIFDITFSEAVKIKSSSDIRLKCAYPAGRAPSDASSATCAVRSLSAANGAVPQGDGTYANTWTFEIVMNDNYFTVPKETEIDFSFQFLGRETVDYAGNVAMESTVVDGNFDTRSPKIIEWRVAEWTMKTAGDVLGDAPKDAITNAYMLQYTVLFDDAAISTAPMRNGISVYKCPGCVVAGPKLDGAVLTFNVSNVTDTSQVKIDIAQGLVKDNAGNAIGATVLKGPAVDRTQPKVFITNCDKDLTPVDGGMSMTVCFDFNEKVGPVSGDSIAGAITVSGFVLDGALVGPYTETQDSHVKYKQVIKRPASATGDVPVKVTLTCNQIKDTAGNLLDCAAGQNSVTLFSDSSNQGITFISDTTPPTIMSVSGWTEADGKKLISNDFTVTVKFSEPLDSADLSLVRLTNVTIPNTAVPVPSSVVMFKDLVYTTDRTIVTFKFDFVANPTADAVLKLEILPGFGKDKAGNALATGVSHELQLDSVAPVPMRSASPLKVNKGFVLKYKFPEPVREVSGVSWINLEKSGDGGVKITDSDFVRPTLGGFGTEWRFNVELPLTAISGKFTVTLKKDMFMDKAGNGNPETPFEFIFDKTLDDCEMDAGRQLASDSSSPPTIGIEVVYGGCALAKM